MATLVLGAVGTLVGGPLGGAIGATLGRGLDAMAFGSGRREGPRLRDLAVSTSSYGQPIVALYGTVRVPGTVIWASDLQERREDSGGGKGRPATTNYSYSVSLAVALSSRPIAGIGRIWADGNLLRGRAGDLKTGGTLRIYSGHADQRPDPLMAAAIGPQCPAHRGCAYVVFEDLALEDFGNRIPALSFEVLAGQAADLVETIARSGGLASKDAAFPELDGFIHEGGSAASVLALVDRLRPLAATMQNGRASIDGIGATADPVPVLPPPSVWDDGEFGRETGVSYSRSGPAHARLQTLRYYDPSRDYQPGLQRVPGDVGDAGGAALEFPGVFSASSARGLSARAARRERMDGETLAWRTATLDPAIGPGSVVRAPGRAGLWLVAGWEWREGGIELDLVRFADAVSGGWVADSGSAWSPPDRTAVETRLRVFELPADGTAPPDTIRRFAAVGAPAGLWAGAALYRLEGDAMVPVGASGPVRAGSGLLLHALAPDRGLRFAAGAGMRVGLDDHEADLTPATLAELARGANRLLVGNEVVQFARCDPLGGGQWHLSGLLRGRGGTEMDALAGHPPGTPVTLLDGRLMELPVGLDTGEGDRFAALGRADDAPVVAELENPGIARRPLFPVHPRHRFDSDGALVLEWTRRARGGWRWLDHVDLPLVEQNETYLVGLGDPQRPVRTWITSSTTLRIAASEIAELVSLPAGAALWVRQQGSYALSSPLRLANLPATN